MAHHFRNLVFEGGGVKGIAYVGAMQELEARGILPGIQRVAGTSAGAINAALLGLGYSNEEMRDILWDLDFAKMMDSNLGLIRNSIRLFTSFGWFKGDFCYNWLAGLVKAKTGSPDTTFAQAEVMKEAKAFKSMHFLATNLCTGFSEVFSAEKTPDARIVDAVRFSMSIPFFFAAKRYGQRRDIYVDGGVIDNYPVKVFDREKYVLTAGGSRETQYYATVNQAFLQQHPHSSPYIYNKETLGFRLDSKDEIAMFRDQKEPVVHEVKNLFDFIKRVALTYLDSQNNEHLHSDDWQRTIYIDTLGVGATEFSLAAATKEELVASGRSWTRQYFAWYDNPGEASANK